ncbi:MAG: extracellular solute-binding protein [Clostridium sp.]|nr:extracellular solute-binding protein [Clostridium sp.]
MKKAFVIADSVRKGADTILHNNSVRRFGRNVTVCAIAVSLAAGLAACGSGAPAPETTAAAEETTTEAAAGAAEETAEETAAAEEKTGGRRVVIYTPTEDYLIEYMQQRLDKAFPDDDISIEYYHTGDLAAKVRAEGTDTECDIIFDCEYGYLQSLNDLLLPIDFVDESQFVDDMLSPDKTYMPVDRYSGSVITRDDILEEKGLPIPESYDDLLDPMYKGLIEMPSPGASSTGYLFLKSLANARGDEAAVEYFHALDENILQYPGGGSGPVKDAAAGECAIALSLTFKAAELITEGSPLTIHFFEEGAPYTPAGLAIIKGHEENEAVVEVVKYFYSDIIDDYLNTYLPESVKKGQVNNVENYPKDIPYADMSNNTPDVKEALISMWEDK